MAELLGKGPRKREYSVLVTGATGYIGSHVVLELLNAGYRVLAIGGSTTAAADGAAICVLPQCLMRALVLATCAAGSMLKFRRCNLQSLADLEDIFRSEQFEAVVHLASSKGVAPSIAAPLEYYFNNLLSSINLLKMCEKYGRRRFVFMSSATVYGVPSELPVTEQSPTGLHITNPYGWAKHAVEQMLQDLGRASKLAWAVAILRAFDPAGAHPSGLLGEDLDAPGPKQLMPLIASVALGKMPGVRICGTTFDTSDGSGSRDFVHVVDVARAVVLAMERIGPGAGERSGPGGEADSSIEVYNIGLGRAHTVLQMVANFERASGKKIHRVLAPARAGDIASIYCDIGKAQRELGWTPQFGVDQICAHLHRWHCTCPNGYK